ncbi:MAG: NAD-dependent malic enzyme [Candidatus Riflebacteria bacterium]|nr:NAD-dependent malic enzyme [Candidatus Riflebacteria bacterium]
MEYYRTMVDKKTGERYVAVSRRGVRIRENPILNKGSAFTEQERQELGLLGILPPKVSTIHEQLTRVRGHFVTKTAALDKFIYLGSLQDRNETLFYRFLLENIEELLPIVYTPVVGEACQKFSHIYRRARGVYITPDDVDRIDTILENVDRGDIHVIVVTDNERILGLGDQGAGGMGIPIGKLTIYTSAAGLHPGRTLPISLDVGTDNRALLEDPMYLGVRRPRLRGAEYDRLVEAFVKAVRKRWPKVLLQWEDFANTNAFRLLNTYRDKLCTFNDDIQGTGAVALAGLIAAARAKRERMSDQTIVFLGAGEAASGIAAQIVDLMVREGTPDDETRRKLWFVDSKGLVLHGDRKLAEHKERWARDAGEVAKWQVRDRKAISLHEVVCHTHPTILCGTSGTPGTFTEEVIREMARHCKQPVILPLSNPTSKAECTPAQAYAWTGGGCFVATGSPFEPVVQNGKKYRIGQANNAFIFPGVGLACVSTQARHVSDGMFRAAAEALAGAVTDGDIAEGSLYPPVSRIREISRKVAVAVAKEAVSTGCADACPPEQVADRVENAMWYPDYLPYRYEPQD